MKLYKGKKKNKYRFLTPKRRGKPYHIHLQNESNIIPALVEMSARPFLIKKAFQTIASGRSLKIHWHLISSQGSNIPSQKALGRVWHNRKSECPRAIFGLSS